VHSSKANYVSRVLLSENPQHLTTTKVHRSSEDGWTAIAIGY